MAQVLYERIRWWVQGDTNASSLAKTSTDTTGLPVAETAQRRAAFSPVAKAHYLAANLSQEELEQAGLGHMVKKKGEVRWLRAMQETLVSGLRLLGVALVAGFNYRSIMRFSYNVYSYGYGFSVARFSVNGFLPFLAMNPNSLMVLGAVFTLFAYVVPQNLASRIVKLVKEKLDDPIAKKQADNEEKLVGQERLHYIKQLLNNKHDRLSQLMQFFRTKTSYGDAFMLLAASVIGVGVGVSGLLGLVPMSPLLCTLSLLMGSAGLYIIAALEPASVDAGVSPKSGMAQIEAIPLKALSEGHVRRVACANEDDATLLCEQGAKRGQMLAVS